MITKLLIAEEASAPIEIDEAAHQPPRPKGCEDFIALTQTERIGVRFRPTLSKLLSMC